MQAPLSVIVLTFNEEANIRACLTSVSEWAGEVFVVDSLSTDRTVAIAEACGASLTVRPTAIGENKDVKFVVHFGREQGLPNHGARRCVDEIVIERPAVDSDLSFARSQKDARNRGLAAACS